jgi:hypothetical protein
MWPRGRARRGGEEAAGQIRREEAGGRALPSPGEDPAGGGRESTARTTGGGGAAGRRMDEQLPASDEQRAPGELRPGRPSRWQASGGTPLTSSAQGRSTPPSAAWIEEACGSREQEREGKQLGCRSPQTPQNARVGRACCILQQPLRQPLEPVQWLQDLRTPVAAWVAETVGDSLIPSPVIAAVSFPVAHVVAEKLDASLSRLRAISFVVVSLPSVTPPTSCRGPIAEHYH